ncbi:hypothetical protein [Escherichia phage vB_EcoM_IME392]|nr:hypothetical protein [Escherichia phage vB_EcoM_IME392]
MTEQTQVKKLDVAGIKALAGKMKERKEKSGGTGNFPNATFLPEGSHQGRIITDPVGNLYREVRTHGYFSYGIQTPSDCEDLPENFNYAELDDMLEELNEYNHWKYGLKYNILFYFFLQKTDTPSDNWKPNTLYAVIGNGKVANALTDFITALAEDSPEVLEGMLDKDVKGSPVKITVVRGNQGSVTFTPLFSKADPVVVDQTYQPLSQAYIREGFDKDKYVGLVKRVRKDLDEIRSQRKAKGLPLVGEDGFEELKAEEEAKAEEAKSDDKVEDTKSDAKSEPTEDQAKSDEAGEDKSETKSEEKSEDKVEDAGEDKSDEGQEEGGAASRFAKFRKN